MVRAWHVGVAGLLVWEVRARIRRRKRLADEKADAEKASTADAGGTKTKKKTSASLRHVIQAFRLVLPRWLGGKSTDSRGTGHLLALILLSANRTLLYGLTHQLHRDLIR